MQTEDLRISLRVRRFLLSEISDHQRIDVFDSYEMGRVLALDSRIQLTERDEFLYHEMLVHPAMLTHPDPRRVLVVGGGDGGAVREVLKHPTVERVVQVELDAAVVEAARRFLPGLSSGYSDPRHELVIGDGVRYVEETGERFDVVVVDSTDPIGEASPLFSDRFYSGVARVLLEGGIVEAQGETPFLYPDVTGSLCATVKRVLGRVKVILGFVPSYQSGMWAFVLGSRDADLEVPPAELRRRYEERGLEGRTRFYTPEVHVGLSNLPPFIRELLDRHGV